MERFHVTSKERALPDVRADLTKCPAKFGTFGWSSAPIQLFSQVTEHMANDSRCPVAFSVSLNFLRDT